MEVLKSWSLLTEPSWETVSTLTIACREFCSRTSTPTSTTSSPPPTTTTEATATRRGGRVTPSGRCWWKSLTDRSKVFCRQMASRSARRSFGSSTSCIFRWVFLSIRWIFLSIRWVSLSIRWDFFRSGESSCRSGKSCFDQVNFLLAQVSFL